MKFIPLTDREEYLAKFIVNAAYEVHKQLGPGLLEKVYEVCLSHLIMKCGVKTQRQVTIPIIFDGLQFEEGLRLDMLVDDIVICEIKAIENVNPVWEAQVLSHLKKTTGTKWYCAIYIKVENLV